MSALILREGILPVHAPYTVARYELATPFSMYLRRWAAQLERPLLLAELFGPHDALPDLVTIPAGAEPAALTVTVPACGSVTELYADVFGGRIDLQAERSLRVSR